MKKLLLLTAGTFATVLSSAMIMKMYYPDGTTQKFNIDDVSKVSYEGNASSRKIVVEYGSQTDTLSAVADSVVFLNGEMRTANGHEYVDLGLSFLWAANNIGATDYALGGKFAWAETEPSTDYEYHWKDSYDDSNLDETSKKGFFIKHRHKYTSRTIGCVFSDYSTRYGSDGLTRLLSVDDAAYVNWGPMWSTPSDDAWEELLENCTFKYFEDYHGQSGYLLTSTVPGYEDKSIFLPVEIGMFKNNSGEFVPCEQSVYWTSTKKSDAVATNFNPYAADIWGVCLPTPDAQSGFSKDGGKPLKMWASFSKSLAGHIRPVIRKRSVEKYGLKSASANGTETYNVVYLNSDRFSILKVESVTEGKAAVGSAELLEKLQKPQENMVFSQWSADLTAVDEDLVVYPIFVTDTLHTYYKVRILCPDTIRAFSEEQGTIEILAPNDPYASIFVREGEDVDSTWLEYSKNIFLNGYNIKHGLKLTDVHSDIDITFERMVNRDFSEQKGKHKFVDLGLSINWASEDIDTYSMHISADSLKTLINTGDVATQLWGSEWRMPTIEEFQELIDNCYIDRIRGYFDENGEYVGRTGYLFTSKVPGFEGRTIFLRGIEHIMDCGPSPLTLVLNTEYATSTFSFENKAGYIFDGNGVVKNEGHYYSINLRAVTAK